MNILYTVLAIVSLIGGCVLLYIAVTMIEDKAMGSIFVGVGIMMVLNGFSMFARMRR